MSSLPSATVAGLLLAAISHLKKLGLATPAATDVITALGTSRTTAYKAKSALVALLPKLLRPPGRPAKHEPLELERAQRQLVLRDVALDFVYAHPGCVSSDGARRCYYKRFRCFVLDLVAEHRAVSLEDLAEAVHVPLGTLKDWLRGGHTQTDSVEPVTSASGATIPQVETVLTAWETWDGGFRDFCQHVQLHWRVPLSRQHISDILEAEGVRIPKRRTRRPPDASALRGGFVTFFPRTQWVGDGTELVVEVCGLHFICNLELGVD